MKLIRHKRFPLFAGLVLIIVTNVIALAGVAYNRSGEPDSVIVLTERELAMPYRYVSKTDNSGLQLHLRWRTDYKRPMIGHFGNNSQKGLHWLTPEKLAKIGFDTSQSLNSETAKQYYKKMLPRQAYLVLEYNGESHKAAITHQQNKLVEEQALLTNTPDSREFEKRVKAAQVNFDSEKYKSSRLFVIDADKNKEALRQRYADDSKYIILRGQIGLRVNYSEGHKQNSLYGYIKRINTVNLNVDHVYHKPLERLTSQSVNRYQAHKPRYAVRIAIGKRAEPWVMDVQALDSEGLAK